MSNKFLLVLCLIITSFVTNVGANIDFLPVVLVHGLSSDPQAMAYPEQVIKLNHEGTYVLTFHIANNNDSTLEEMWKSEESMWEQTQRLRDEICRHEQLRAGFIFIGHSQGGLVARAYVETQDGDDFRARRLITWGTPHAGQFGIPYEENNVVDTLGYEAYQVLYSKWIQDHLSIAQYWNDPLHHDDYVEKSVFLAMLNNEVDHENAQKFKDNLLQLDKLVAFMSKNDEIIKPRQSSWFDFYSYGVYPLELQELPNREMYDTLGLNTLQISDKLHFQTATCAHTGYETDPHVLEITLQYLVGYNSEESENYGIKIPMKDSQGNGYLRLVPHNWCATQ